ncbi:MAG: insulinase family protein [Gemmatimonadaceae bacterium]|nr:insulinase family protein [Gemmatimonadaceae bacterium]
MMRTVGRAAPLALLLAGAGLLLPARAAHAQRAADSATVAFEVNGLQVIHRRVTANEVVAANLYLLGGVSQVPASKAGLELLLLESSERGTRKYPREALERKMARLGSAIVASPSIDWTMVGVRSTVTAFDSTFAIFADRIMQPRLDSSEVESVRTTIISGVRQRGDDPEALLNTFSDSVSFAGHPYGTPPLGSEATLRAISLADLRQWHRTQFVTSRMLLVVVGDISRTRLEAMVRATLGTMPRGEYRWAPPLVPAPRASSLHVIARPLPTNYLQGYWVGPRADSRDYQPMRIAMAALGGRLFTEVRVKRNLTYAVNAPFVDRAVTAAGLYVTTTQPDSVLGIMRREVEAMKRGFIDPEGLRLLVQQFITEFFLDNETNSDQATFLARSELYRGDWRLAGRFVDELRKVTPEDIQRVARQYLSGLTMAYVGDPRRVSGARVTTF